KFSSDQNSNDDLFLNSPSSSTIARGNSVAFRVAAAELAAEKVQHRGVLPPLIRAPDSAQHANRPAPEQKCKMRVCQARLIARQSPKAQTGSLPRSQLYLPLSSCESS